MLFVNCVRTCVLLGGIIFGLISCDHSNRAQLDVEVVAKAETEILPAADGLGHAMLGVLMVPPSSYVHRINKTLPHQGVLVKRVFPDTLAQEIGIERGDVIMRVNDVDITSMSRFREQVNAVGVGGMVNLDILRSGKAILLSGILREWAEGVPNKPLDSQAEKQYREIQVMSLKHGAIFDLYTDLNRIGGAYIHVPTIDAIFSRLRPDGAVFVITAEGGELVLKMPNGKKAEYTYGEETAQSILDRIQAFEP